MKVFTYWDNMDFLAPAGGLLDIWVESWKKHGWEPVISSKKDLDSHPRFQEAKDHVMILPSVNPWEYEWACYMRWLAAEQSGSRLCVDTDTINFGFTPEDAAKLSQDKVVSLIHNGCPAAVWMPEGYCLLDWILKYRPEHAGKENGFPHCSDQSMFIWLCENRMDVFESVDICKQYGDNRWEQGKLVHFPTGATVPTGKNKVEVIKSCIGKLG
jgi:hypothetical protein